MYALCLCSKLHITSLEPSPWGPLEEIQNIGGKPSWVYSVIFKDVLPKNICPLGNPCNIITRSSAIFPHFRNGGRLANHQRSTGTGGVPLFNSEHASWHQSPHVEKKLNHALQTNIPLGYFECPRCFAASFTNVTSLQDMPSVCQGFSTWRENCNDSDDIELPARREVDFGGNWMTERSTIGCWKSYGDL